jgi:hypothetical protein
MENADTGERDIDRRREKGRRGESSVIRNI